MAYMPFFSVGGVDVATRSVTISLRPLEWADALVAERKLADGLRDSLAHFLGRAWSDEVRDLITYEIRSFLLRAIADGRIWYFAGSWHVE